MRVAVVTISDSVSSGKSEDRSGPAVVTRCKELGWQIVSSHVLPDDRATIEKLQKKTADANDAAVILTTGGTGVGPRDVTPEATIAVVERLIPGFGEHMRSEGATKTPRALWWRAVAGFRGTTISINLPGRPRGWVESLDAIAEFLPHAVSILHGARHD